MQRPCMHFPTLCPTSSLPSSYPQLLNAEQLIDTSEARRYTYANNRFSSAQGHSARGIGFLPACDRFSRSYETPLTWGWTWVGTVTLPPITDLGVPPENMSFLRTAKYVVGMAAVRRCTTQVNFRTKKQVVRAIQESGGFMSVSLTLQDPGSNILRRLRATYGVNFDVEKPVEHLALLQRLPASDQAFVEQKLSQISKSQRPFDFGVGRPYRTTRGAKAQSGTTRSNVFFHLRTSGSLGSPCNRLSADFQSIIPLHTSFPGDQPALKAPRFSVAKRLTIEEADRLLKEAEHFYQQQYSSEVVIAIGLSLSVYKSLGAISPLRINYPFVGND